MTGAAFATWVAGAAVLTGVLAGLLPPAWGHLATVLLLSARLEHQARPLVNAKGNGGGR